MYNINTPGGTVDYGIIVNKLFLIPTRAEGYNPAYKRPYTMNLTAEKVTNISNLIHGGNKISDVGVTQHVGNVVDYASTPIGMAEIANGWGTVRLRFILEVEQPHPPNSSLVHYVQGYTEYHDPSLSGTLDPNMIFFINSITTVNKVITPTGEIVVTPYASNNILIGDDNLTTDSRFIRPVDIVADIAHNHVVSNMDSGGSINTLPTVGMEMAVSRKGNNDTVKYFTKTLNEHINSVNIAGKDSELTDIYTTVEDILAESTFRHNAFLSAINSITGDFKPNTFTLNILNGIQPNIADLTTYIDKSNELLDMSNMSMLTTVHTEDMLQPKRETLLANKLLNNITSVMTENLISELDLSITNRSGQLIVTPSNFNTFVMGLDPLPYINRIVSRIDTVYGPEITNNNMTLVEIHLHIDVFGDSSIGVSLDGAAPTIYRVPAYADSLYAPVKADVTSREAISNDFDMLFNTTYVDDVEAYY